MFSRQATQSARVAARCVRRPAARATPNFRTQQPRFQSTASQQQAAGTVSPAMIGALTGTLATLTVGYVAYRQSGAYQLVKASQATQNYVNTATQKIKESTPEPNEALEWLRSAAQSYAAFIPGAKKYVDSAFDDLDAIRAKHGDEVDAIVRDAYEDMRQVLGNGDVSLVTAHKTWDVITKHLARVGDLAGDASQQIMDNHPKLKEQLGGNWDKLRELGDSYGPEVKKEVDRTWDQINDIVKTGLSVENIAKIKSMINEKVEKAQKLGDVAWQKGLEQAKPYLEKSPEVKKLVEDNADALKKGNLQELFQRVKTAVEKGDTGDLEKYVKGAASKVQDKAKSSGGMLAGAGGGIEKLLGGMPGGDQILPKLSQLQDVAEKHGDEAQQILKKAVSEISDVLKKHGDQAQKLASKAKDDVKK